MVALSQDLVEGLDLIDMRLTTDGNDVDFRLGVDFKANSKFANMKWSNQANLQRVASLIPAKHPIGVAMSMDFPAVMKWFTGFLKDIGEQVGQSDEEIARTLKMIELSTNSMRLLDRDIALSFGYPS
jgi:hypothetical protein